MSESQKSSDGIRPLASCAHEPGRSLSKPRLAEILSLAQAAMERLHGGDRSGADELLAAQASETLRDLRQAAALLEYHARVQLYIRNERLYRTDPVCVLREL